MARIKQDTSLERVLSYLTKAPYLTERGYRSKATIRTIFWKSSITQVIAHPTSLTKELLTKRFLHTFFNVSATLETLDTYFDWMSRQFWETNKEALYDFFLDQTAHFNAKLKQVNHLILESVDAHPGASFTPFNLKDVDVDGKRSGQSLSEILVPGYPNELIISTDPEIQILINHDIPEDQIKRVHQTMMDACSAHITMLIYHTYFLPFEDSPHLPFLKTT